MTRDYALGPDPAVPDRPLLHRADCPMVRAQAAAGLPVATLFGVAHEPRRRDLPRHACLEEPPAG